MIRMEESIQIPTLPILRRASSINRTSHQFDLQVRVLNRTNSLGIKEQKENLGKDLELDGLLDTLGLINENENATVFESSIDLSPERLSFIYHTFDTDHNGKISYEELRKGIEFWADISSHDLTELEFNALVEYLDADGSKDISEEEFGNGLRMIALRRLFSSHVPIGSPINIVDYVNVKMQSSTVKTLEEHHTFCTQQRPDWVQNRWIDTIGDGENAAITLQRLAVKYLLHPLAVEDALEEHHRPKVDSFPTHLHLMIPIISLTTTDATTHHDETKSRNAPTTKVEMVSIFVNIPRNDTLITFRKKKKTDKAEENTNTWSRIKKGLQKTYSKLRQYDCQYLLYGMLDAAVDRVPPIIKQWNEIIEDEKKWLVSTRYINVDRVANIREEIVRMVRQLKPFQRVLTHVIEDDAICQGATIYLKDVKDNLERSVDDLKEMIEQCNLMNLEYEKFHQGSMDRRLYFMTVVTSIFLPAQFLTGVWGMNFENMPELKTDYVYPLFWIFTLIGIAIYPMMLFVSWCRRRRLN